MQHIVQTVIWLGKCGIIKNFIEELCSQNNLFANTNFNL